MFNSSGKIEPIHLPETWDHLGIIPRILTIIPVIKSSEVVSV